MSLINCRVCLSSISENACKCPSCGEPRTTSFTLRVTFFTTLLLIALLGRYIVEIS